MALTASYPFHGLTIELHEATTGTPVAHPAITMNIPSGPVILGGGAAVDCGNGPGSLLTAMFPATSVDWQARAKDHGLSSPATIAVACFAASIPPADYLIVDATSPAPVNHPDATAMLPPGFVLVGGGARVNVEDREAPGSLLWASRPAAGQGWYAAAKDHVYTNPSTVTAFAIGVTSSFLASKALRVVRFHGDASTAVPHPGADCGADAGLALIGGGAETHWRGVGSLLTASIPVNPSVPPVPAGPYLWTARGKDHLLSDPSTISAWGLALVSCGRD
jgi:hypothetical protein